MIKTINKGFTSIVLLGLFLIIAPGNYAQTSLTLDASDIKGTMEGRGAGFCNSFVTDRPELTPQLGKAKAATLRFPMGGIAKNYLFHNFDKDYTDIDNGLRPRICSREQYYSGDIDIKTGTNEFKPELLGFDEFIAMCQSIGAEPVIMLSAEGDLLDGSMVSKEQLLKNAIEWIKYAKSNGYNITYWEFGNEVHFNRPNSLITAEEYVSRYLYLQDTLKKIDPNIKLGAVTVGYNNHTDIIQMLQFPDLISKLDFFVTHQYNTSGILDYPTWKNATQDIVNPSWDNTKDDIRDVKRAIKYFDDHIHLYPNLASVEYLITEHSTHIAGPGPKQWHNGGQHIVQSIFGFQQVANMFLYDQRIKYTHFWVTTSPFGDRSTFDGDAEAFDMNNNWEITPQGMAISIFNNFTKDNLIQPVVNGAVGCYASSSADGKQLTLFVINKNNTETEVNINLSNYSGSTDNVKWIYSGTGDPYDKNPVLRQFDFATVDGNNVHTTLEPVSLTIIELGKSLATGQVPEKPDNLETTNGNEMVPTVAISFNAAPNASFYALERKTSNGDFETVTLLDAHELSFTDVSVVDGETYTYRLRAGNAHGYSDYSSEAKCMVSSSIEVRLINGQGTNLALDGSNENVVKSTNNMAKSAQVWILEPSGDFYKVINKSNKKYLFAENGNATLSATNSGDDILWNLELIGGQNYYLKQKSSEQYLAGTSQSSGTTVVIEPYSGWAKQQWTLIVADNSFLNTITNGNFEMDGSLSPPPTWSLEQGDSYSQVREGAWSGFSLTPNDLKAFGVRVLNQDEDPFSIKLYKREAAIPHENN